MMLNQLRLFAPCGLLFILGFAYLSNFFRETLPCTVEEGSKGGFLVPLPVQIWTNFTYHVGYKPIFTNHESHLLIKGANNQNIFIMDPSSHFI